MTKLEYTFMNDTLFKTLFGNYPELLKRLVAELLKIPFESIGQFDRAGITKSFREQSSSVYWRSTSLTAWNSIRSFSRLKSRATHR